MTYRTWIHSRRREAARRRRQFAPGRDTVACYLEDRALLATITVTTTADITDASDGQTSLREAVATATATSGATEIDLPAGTYNLSSTTEMLLGRTAGQNITIKGLGGAGSTIINQTVGNTRIFNIDNNQAGNIAVTLVGLTLQGASNVTKVFGGGAIVAGGPSDSLSIQNSVFQNNSTSNSTFSVARAGGAISYSGGGNLTISGSTFKNNTAGGNANAGSFGGAVAFNNSTNAGQLTITNSTFDSNSATGTNATYVPEGGAVSVSGSGNHVITGSTFTNNTVGTALGKGGGVYLESSGSNLTIQSSTFVNNTAASGGGISATTGSLNVLLSRFYNNTATSGEAINNGSATVTANDNWWGADDLPNRTGTDTTSGTIAISTRLTLVLTPSPATIAANGSATLRTSIVSTGAPSTLLTGTALEGLTLTFAPGSFGSVNPTTATISNGIASTTYQPNGSFGTTQPSVRLDNGTKITTLTVIGAPTANGQSVTTAFNTAKTITLTGSDPNSPPRSLTYTISANPAHGTLSGTAPNLTYTPTAGYHGTDSFTFTTNNGFATSTPATVSITVTPGTPTANNQTVSVAHDTAKPITLTGSDPDSPPLSLTYAIATSPAHGTLSGFNATTGAVTYTPNAGYHGVDSFTFTTNNGTNTSNAATVTLNVAPDTPTVGSRTVTVTHNTATAVTLSATDDDNPPLTLTYTVITQPTKGTLSGSGANLTYTPNVGSYGTDTFTYTASNGTNTSNTGTITLSVTPSTPTASNQTVAVAHNTATSIALNVTDGDDNPPLALTSKIQAQPTHGTLSGSGTNLTYTPTAGYQGTDTFSYTVTNGSYTSNTATVTLNVAPATPTANPQSVSTNQNTPVAVTLTGTDGDDNPPLPLTYNVTTAPTHGTLSGSGANLTYTPTAGYTGSDSFAFTTSNGVNTSTPATVSLTVVSTVATVSGTVGVSWGTAGSTSLQTASDGLRLLATGRSTDLPWLGISKVTITLNQAAPLSASDVSVTGINVANYGPVSISGSGTTYTITLAQPINAADRVTLTIGNANITTFTRRLDVLPGDVNDDGAVTQSDAILIRNEYLGIAGAVPTVAGDINGDGVVDINDYNVTRRLIGTILP